MTGYRVMRVPGKTMPESASCDDDACEWQYEGEKAITEAKAHTLGTGHDTVVWSTKAAWYSRMAVR